MVLFSVIIISKNQQESINNNSHFKNRAMLTDARDTVKDTKKREII